MRFRPRRAFRFSLIVAFIIWAGFWGRAHGQATGLTIQPVKISHTLQPGEAVSGTILLSNASAETVQLEMKVEDFIPLAGGEGLQFVGRAPGATTVRDWVTLKGDKEFLFEPRASQNVGYTIAAPPDAEPGSHFGVIFFKASKPDDGSEQLKIGTQVGVLVFVTIPGDRLQQGRILEFSGPNFIQRGPVAFKIKFENTGTVHFEPKGAIKIVNLFGREVGSAPVEGQVVLPTGVKELLVEWRTSGLFLGRYLATAVIVDGEGNRLTSETWSFYAAPLWYLAAFLLAVIVVFFLLRFIRHRIRINISLK